MTEQLDLLTYPSNPGWKREGTSREAAESVKGRVAFLQGKCLRALQIYGPLTADECAEKIGETVLSTRPRLTELKATYRIEDSGQRRRNISGRPATVWRLA